MVARAGRIALLTYQAMWLCAIVPGHARGVVVLPGTSDNSHCCHSSSKSKPTDADAAKRRANCAICSFAARLSQAPAVDLKPPPMRLLERLAPPAAHVAPSIEQFPTYLGRAPPGAV
jgi:hypothetical protein